MKNIVFNVKCTVTAWIEGWKGESFITDHFEENLHRMLLRNIF